MDLNEVKKRAMEVEVEPGTMSKGELIRAIQVAEGNPPSFGKNDGNCPDCRFRDCCWWEDCIQAHAVGKLQRHQDRPPSGT
jgi:hypothetical protein